MAVSKPVYESEWRRLGSPLSMFLPQGLYGYHLANQVL